MGSYPTTITTDKEGYKARPEGKMKALAWFGTNDVRVIEAGIPDIVDPDDVVLVRSLVFVNV